DYGTGEAGNWGCHILDIAYWALDLKYPTKVGIEKANPDPVMTPTAFHSWFEFPAAGDRAALTLHWYQGKPAIMDKLGLKGVGGGFDWDAVGLKASGNSKVDEFLVPHFRKGWEV